MVRYLSEMMWFPSAFLEDNVSFEAVDAVGPCHPSPIVAGLPPGRFLRSRRQLD